MLLQKHKLEGFGKLGATGIFLWLSTSAPGLTKGFWGQFIYYCLTKVFSAAASKGLVFLNVGIETIETLSEEKDFNGTMDEAFRIINSKGSLTPEEIKAIDDKVKKSFRKFADMST
jgi:hypothetical protein